MLSEFEENLFHLESGREGFNKHGTADGTRRDADIRLREVEYIIPETGFKVMLHLWKIEIRARASSNQFLGIVEKVKSKVEDGCGDRSIIDSQTGLIQMPTTRTIRVQDMDHS